MKHLMVDIETLDTRPTAVILSVAVLMFDPVTRAQEEMYSANIDVSLQIMAEGRTMSIDTITWWMQQGYDARVKAFASPVCAHPRDAQETLASIIKRPDIDAIWANDPDFDCVILRDFMGYDFKWPFYKHRSMRTIKALFPLSWKLRKDGTEYGDFIAHDPMEDCKQQAWHVMNIYEREDLHSKTLPG